MEFPSSPPLLPEFDPPSSSPIPLPTLRPTFSRKRQLSDYASYASQSSDPLFSEEVSEAELGDPDEPKRKRLVRGPWWTLKRRKSTVEALRRTVGKRGLQPADSGVWMASDDEQLGDRSSEPGAHNDSPSSAHLLTQLSEKHRIALNIVHSALEDGKEVIDLSDLDLDDIPNKLLQPLHQLILHPQGHDTFRALTPAIQLYLSRNNLSTLPTELFRFSNLTVLSLRNNRLQVLPPAICQLPRLRELNVAGNELQYFPWEMKELLHKTSDGKVNLQPNPLFTMDFDQAVEIHNDTAKGTASVGEIITARLVATNQQLRVTRKDEPYTTRFLAASRITYFNNDGRVTKGQHLASHQAVFDHDDDTSVQGQSVPSLFELVLRRAQTADVLREVVALLPMDVPDGIAKALNQALLLEEIGNQQCTTCGHEMIIPKAAWTEYWTDDSRHKVVLDGCYQPFLRKACTVACAKPSKVGSYTCNPI